ncbi:MAG: hypothetical protein ACRDRP_24470 [Pseudonocardiaceae bacterium]
MGTILELYGDDAYEHEGYAAQVLDDGTLTSTYNNGTESRMVGQLVAACGCGWTGSTRYPTTDRFDEAAEELALEEWERSHARPALEGLRAGTWDRLRSVVRRLAESHATATATRFGDLAPAAERDLLDRTLAALDTATRLARQLRAPLADSEDPGTYDHGAVEQGPRTGSLTTEGPDLGAMLPASWETRTAAAVRILFDVDTELITGADAFGALVHYVTQYCTTHDTTPIAALTAVDPADREFARRAVDPAAFMAAKVRDLP